MDLELVETKNGGDVIKKTKDLSVIFGFENMPYLCTFGGNVEASTPITRLESEERFDYWANELLMANESDIQFNSETERTLRTVAINSAGRVKIEQAIRKDLKPMESFVQIDNISVSLITVDMIGFAIRLRDIPNQQNRDFVYIWDITNQELIDRENYLNVGKITADAIRYFERPFFEDGFFE